MASLSAWLNKETLLGNIPLLAQLELTWRCHLSCEHCYLPSKRPSNELSTFEWRRVLDELSVLGCLSIVFTGGEPLLRNDLLELCKYASKKNFEIRIFSSGLGVKADLIKKMWPFNISKFEISFYGRPQIHDAITKVIGSQNASLAAARAIKKSGFRVKLKIPLMKRLINEIDYIIKLAEKEKFEYAFDPVLTITSDGNKANLKRRLSYTELKKALHKAKLDFACDKDVEDIDLSSPVCGAGRNTININPYGDVLPCLQLGVKIGNIRKQSLRDIWSKSRWLIDWRKKTMADLHACRGCKYLKFCSRCPGISLQEKGNIDEPYTLACMLAKNF